MKGRTFPVYLVFLVMGFGDLIGPLVSLMKQKLTLTGFEASFIAFAGFIMFGTLSIPTGIFQKKYGQRVTVLAGLLFVLAGLIAPAFTLQSYGGFLFAVLLLGAGVTILQVSGSPLLHTISAAGSYARNLTFGQFIKGIGTLSSPLIPILAYRYFDNRWEIVFWIFSGATVATILVFMFTRAGAGSKPAGAVSLRTSFGLIADWQVGKKVLGIFLYVGAEVCISAALPSYLQNHYGYALSDYGMAGTGLFFVSLMTGRFLGTLILNVMGPHRFFRASCLLSLAGLALLAFGQGKAGFIAAMVIGVGFSNIFPLVFAGAIESKPDKADELSALMVSAIAGGAIVPPLMSLVGDRSTMQISLVVPALCVLYLTVLSVGRAKSHAASA